jgi:hypothetical protein
LATVSREFEDSVKENARGAGDRRHPVFFLERERVSGVWEFSKERGREVCER